MKFFAIFFAVLTIGCGIFWFTDAPGSGMVYPTLIFLAIEAGVLGFNKGRTGSWLSDTAGNH